MRGMARNRKEPVSNHLFGNQSVLAIAGLPTGWTSLNFFLVVSGRIDLEAPVHAGIITNQLITRIHVIQVVSPNLKNLPVQRSGSRLR